ncbi:MAG: hypothetical protein IT292_02475 [Deltaproteobacteria bacterium]|nr:hypothetical protein [Deltaproteobacteria bacterium]
MSIIMLSHDSIGQRHNLSRGMYLPFVALCLVLLCGFVTLAIDLSFNFRYARVFDLSADAAAKRALAWHLAGREGPPKRAKNSPVVPSFDIGALASTIPQDRIMKVAKQHTVANMRLAGINDARVTNLGVNLIPRANNRLAQVTITADLQPPLFFGRVLGLNPNQTYQRRVTVTEKRSNVYLIWDNSIAMGVVDCFAHSTLDDQDIITAGTNCSHGYTQCYVDLNNNGAFDFPDEQDQVLAIQTPSIPVTAPNITQPVLVAPAIVANQFQSRAPQQWALCLAADNLGNPVCQVDTDNDGIFDENNRQFTNAGNSVCVRRDLFRRSLVNRISAYFSNNGLFRTISYTQDKNDTLCSAMSRAVNQASLDAQANAGSWNATYIIVSTGALMNSAGDWGDDTVLLGQNIFRTSDGSATSLATTATFRDAYNCAVGMSDVMRQHGGRVFTIGFGYAAFQRSSQLDRCNQSPTCANFNQNEWCVETPNCKTNYQFSATPCDANNNPDSPATKTYADVNPKRCAGVNGIANQFRCVQDTNGDGTDDTWLAYQGLNNSRHDLFLRRLAFDPNILAQIRFHNKEGRTSGLNASDCPFNINAANGSNYEGPYLTDFDAINNINRSYGAYFPIAPLPPSLQQNSQDWAIIDSAIAHIARRIKM